MRKNFTRLVCVGIASFCMMAVFGQEKMPVERRVFQKQNEIELRADEGTEYWWPDSVIYYNYLGEPYYKVYYNEGKKTSTSSELENGNWVPGETYSSNGFVFFSMKPTYRVDDKGQHLFFADTYFWVGTIPLGAAFIPVAKYDDKGNLIFLEFSIDFTNTGKPTVIHTYIITYNEKNNPILLEYYWYGYDSVTRTTQYEYDKNGHCTQIKVSEYNEDKEIMEMTQIQKMNFDEKGRPSRGNCLMLKDGTMSSSIIFSYSDKTYTSNVAVENNNPIGTNNLGNFDVNVNIPTDSIGNGSITITFPEGFTLDAKNTRLTADFTNLFTLTVTKQENNSWLLEIKPKTLRSASLRAGEAKKMLQVAYTVDAKKKKGTYDISVNSILFETKGGNYYPEPAITVPAVVNRWGVGIETVENESIWTSGGNLYVRTAKACTVSVYTLPGQLIRQQTVGTGETAIPLPQGIYFVKTGGITRKIFVR